MSFHNDKEERNTVPPVLGRQGPSFRKSSTFGKTPGFSKAAGSIMDRIKGLSRRDLGLVALGLSALVMAPVAEYMMSRPPMDNTLTAGFGSRGMGDGSSIYEPGIHGLSQGSPDGSGEVITPLSARDPASLILGAPKPTPPPMPSAPPSSSLRDTVRDAGREAFSAAVKSGGAPTVIPKMASGLRGMSSFFGGGESSRTSGSLSGGKISEDAKKASGKSASRSMVGPVASAGYKGVAMTPNSSSRGAFEKLRAAAGAAADNFTTGSASEGLDKAAAASINAGSGNGGMGAGKEGDKTKSPSNSSTRDQKSHSGESLAATLARKRAEKALEWEFYKKYEIPKKLIEAVLSGVGSALTEFATSMTKGVLGMGGGAAPTVYYCYVNCADVTKLETCNELEQTTDPKIVDGWYRYNTCQRVTSNKAGSPSTGGGGPSTVGGTSDAEYLASPTPPSDITENAQTAVSGELDTVLLDLARKVREVQGEKDAKDFLEESLDMNSQMSGVSAKYLEQASLLGQEATAIAGKVGEYNTAIAKANTDIASYSSALAAFKAKVEAVNTAGRQDVITEGPGAKTTGGEVSGAVAEIKRKIEGQEGLFRTVSQRVAKHGNISAFYNTQVESMRQNVGAIDAAANNAVQLARTNIQQLEAMNKNEKLSLQDQQDLVTAFRGVAGQRELRFVPQAVSSLPGDKTLFAMAVPGDLRDTVSAAEPVPFDQLLSFRGADMQKLQNDFEVDDKNAKRVETAAWAKSSPRMNYEKIVGQGQPIQAAALPVDLISIGLRVREVPWDIAHVKSLLVSEVATADPTGNINTWTAELKAQGIELSEGGTPGGSTDTDTGTGTTTATSTDAGAGTGTGTGTGAGTGTGTSTATGTGTATATDTATGTNTATGTDTATETAPTQEQLDQQAVQQAQSEGRGIYRAVVANYEAWPQNIPPGGEFAADHTEYTRATAEAERQRLKVNSLYADLQAAETPAEARRILGEMRAAQRAHREQARLAKAAVESALAKDQSRTDIRRWAWDRNKSQLRSVVIKEDNGDYIDMVCNTSDEMKDNFRCQPTRDGMGVVQRCTRPGRFYGCNGTWETVQMKLRDFSLRTGNGTGSGQWQVYPERPIRMGEQDMNIEREDGVQTARMLYQKNPYEIDEHQMDVKVECKYSENTNFEWKVVYATLQKKKASSSDKFDVGIKGGFKPFGVGVEVSALYGHVWNHHRFGEPELAPGVRPGSTCE